MSGSSGSRAETSAVDRTSRCPTHLTHSRFVLSDLRVLVAHDWMFSWAGSERCLALILELFPRADLVVGLMAPSLRDFNDVTRRARETWLARVPGARTHYQWFLPLEAMAFGSLPVE